MSTDAFGDAFADFDTNPAPDFDVTPTPATSQPDPIIPEADAQPTPAQTYRSIDELLAPPEDDFVPAVTAPPTKEAPVPKAPAPTPTISSPAFTLGDDQVTMERIKEEFTKRLTSGDPTDAFLLAAQLGATAATAQFQKELGTLKSTTLRTTVDRFKADMKAQNPKLFAAVEKDFDAQVRAAEEYIDKNPQQAAALTDAYINEALNTYFDKSKARALDRLIEASKKPATTATPTQTDAPAPATPATYGSPSTPATPGAKRSFQPRSKEQAAFADIARSAGLNDDDLKDIFG